MFKQMLIGAVVSAAVWGLGAGLAHAEALEWGAARLFPKGTQDFGLEASYATPTLSDEEIYYSAGGSYGYYFLDGLSLNPGLTGHFVDTEEDDAIGGDFSILLRWHFASYGRFSFFADGGPGVSYFDHRIPPPNGTQFNFFLQGGLGLTYQLQDNLHLITGLRFEHISNAGLQGPDRHPGSNAVAGYIGVMWTF